MTPMLDWHGVLSGQPLQWIISGFLTTVWVSVAGILLATLLAVLLLALRLAPLRQTRHLPLLIAGDPGDFTAVAAVDHRHVNTQRLIDLQRGGHRLHQQANRGGDNQHLLSLGPQTTNELPRLRIDPGQDRLAHAAGHQRVNVRLRYSGQRRLDQGHIIGDIHLSSVIIRH